jgi:5-(carboxyamino)imidazole ribonucleotide synthase
MKKIAVLGGGQLGMMLQEAVSAIEAQLFFLDPDPECSCRSVSKEVTLGSFKDTQDVLDFGKGKDIVTVEIEHVDIPALKELQDQGVDVYPQPDILAMIQDKGAQKEFYQLHNFPTAPFELLNVSADVDIEKWPLPFVIKSRKGGYDGHGVKIVKSIKELPSAFPVPCLVEAKADIQKEISVIVARNVQGDVSAFPSVEMEFDPEANLVSALISPADIPEAIAQEAESLAIRLITELGMIGLLAVEFFWLKDNRLWVNEIAPRPHNSGHQTIEGNVTSQYEQHLRAITGMSLGPTASKGYAVMVNLLGSEGHTGTKHILGLDALAQYEDAFLHDYHKALTRPNRKMGHITVVNEDRDKAMKTALYLQQQVQYVSKS